MFVVNFAAIIFKFILGESNEVTQKDIGKTYHVLITAIITKREQSAYFWACFVRMALPGELYDEFTEMLYALSGPLWGETTGHRWILLTKGQ